MASRREPDDDVVFSSINKIGDVLSTPTPGFPSLLIVYPLALVSSAFLIPLPTALLLTAFFIGYSYLGKQVVGENDANISNFAALILAVPSAGLLSPTGFGNVNGQGLALVVAILGLGLITATIVEALPSKDEKLLDEWDDKFDKDSRDS